MTEYILRYTQHIDLTALSCSDTRPMFNMIVLLIFSIAWTVLVSLLRFCFLFGHYTVLANVIALAFFFLQLNVFARVVNILCDKKHLGRFTDIKHPSFLLCWFCERYSSIMDTGLVFETDPSYQRATRMDDMSHHTTFSFEQMRKYCSIRVQSSTELLACGFQPFFYSFIPH